MDVVLFGIQGSGKGTQAKRLAAERDFDIFEAGGELRTIAASGSELGNSIKSYIDAGELVPHTIIMDVVERAIAKRPKNQKILFDGIPRDAKQMKDFDVVMQKLGRKFRCFHIALDPEEGMQRILKRAKIEGRADDASENTIRKRMNTFTEKTMPVIMSYRERGLVEDIDGLGEVHAIFERMLSVWDNLQNTVC
jgi:adenylate kinase